VHPLVQRVVRVGLDGGGPGDPVQVGALHLPVTEVAGGEVDDRPSEVGAERVGGAFRDVQVDLDPLSNQGNRPSSTAMTDGV
jgi:hypothetical protein